jgi:site-specific recombinase XerD
LQAISTDGRKPRRIYDAAKTPLQRLLLSQVLPTSSEQELQRAARMLDPLRLLYHLQDLQQALLCPQTSSSLETFEKAPGAILPFCLERCVGRLYALSLAQPEPVAAHQIPTTGREEDSACATLSAQLAEEDHAGSPQEMAELGAECQPPLTNDSASQSHHLPNEGQASCVPRRRPRPAIPLVEQTIEQAIQDYLYEQESKPRRPKTLEWHQRALGLLQEYLLTEHQCIRLDQITPAQVTGWLAWLPQAPSLRRHPCSAHTVQSYVRSARAFCQWAVRHRLLHATPFARLPLPEADAQPLPQLEAEEWQQLLGACRPPHESGVQAEQATARNQALLWVLFETGMQATELCALRMTDVDRGKRELLVRGKGAQERRFTLGHEGWHQLCTYLDDYRPRASVGGEQAEKSSDHLFLSERG